MHFSQLTTFLLAAEYRSFSRAAQEQYISQPAATKQIRSLEAELGFPLFAMEGRRVVLTEAGARFRQSAEALLACYKNTLYHGACIAEERRSTLRVGLDPICRANDNVLVDFTLACRKACPDLRFEVLRIPFADIRSSLLRESVELCFVPEGMCHPGKKLCFVPLFQDHYRALMSKEHPLSKAKMLRPQDFSGCTLILRDGPKPNHARRAQTAIQKQSHMVKNIIRDNLENIVFDLLTEKGVAIMPSLYCPGNDRVCSVPLQGPFAFRFGILFVSPPRLQLTSLLQSVSSYTSQM